MDDRCSVLGQDILSGKVKLGDLHTLTSMPVILDCFLNCRTTYDVLTSRVRKLCNLVVRHRTRHISLIEYRLCIFSA